MIGRDPLEPAERADDPTFRDRVRTIAPSLSHLNADKLKEHVLNPEAYKQVVLDLYDSPRRLLIDRRMKEYTARTGGFFFVEIGANDGLQGDAVRNHVMDHGWTGLMVEPVPHVYDQLRQNYEGVDGLMFANVAVDSQDGTAVMKVAKPSAAGQDDPVVALSSLDPAAIEAARERIPDIDERMEDKEVPTRTLPTLLDEHGITEIDGLFIDAEGNDGVIVRQLLGLVGLREIDRPQFIQFEHCLMSRQERRELSARLKQTGYSVKRFRTDIFAELA